MKSHIFWQRVFSFLVVAGMLFGYVAPVSASASAQAPEAQPKAEILVEPELMAEFAAKGSAGYLVYFKDKADLSEANKMDWSERGWYVYNALTSIADRSQAAVRQLLDKQKVEYQAFWIDNVIVVESSDLKTFNQLFGFAEIESLRARREPVLYEPEEPSAAVELSTLAVEPNLTWVGADQVWAQGINGSGIVVANIDTGVRYTHQALVNQYRGTLVGGSYDHNYNWWDPYVATQTFPNDVHNHGSHTMGTMLGDDGGANQIGMAPAAKWIACKGFNPNATDAGLLSCAEFMAAPWDLSGANPNPDLRPHIVNNSWGDCGRTYDPWYAGVLASWHAAGIYPVFSNGNSSNCGYANPPGLNTVGNPARSGNVTGVGSTGTTGGVYATYSNWGPTDNLDTVNPRGYPNLKPQVVAPGTNRSAYKDSDTAYGGMSGTSMAAPHVAGLVALIWNAAPCLVGDYAVTETLIEETANPVPYASGGTPPPGPGNVPNYATGWGEIRALAAVNAAANLCGDSELSGVVTDAVTSSPIAGALVRVVGGDVDRTVATDETGAYSFILFEGTYDLTVTKFGYLPGTATGVELGTGLVVTQNFALQPAASAVISGVVTDAVTGWPLYARITVSGAPVPAFWNDPVTGAYSITLPEGGDYGFTANAYVAGYLPKTGSVTGLAGPTTLNLELDVNLMTCVAPGYSVSGGYVENFDSITAPALPATWAWQRLVGTSGEWATRTSTRYPPNQPPHTTPNLVFFNSFSVSSGGQTRLYRTASLDMNAISDPTLTFWMYHDSGYASNNDRVQVQVSLDAGATWTSVGPEFSRYNGTVGWAQKTVDMSAYATASSLRLGILATSAYGNDIHLDSLVIGGTPGCNPTPGSLVVGQVYDANTMAELPGAIVSNQDGFTATSAPTEDPAVGDAFFVVFSPTGEKEFSATKARYGTVVETLTIPTYQTLEQDFYVPAGQVLVDPEEINVSVELGSTLEDTLTISNAGGSSFTFEIQEKDAGSSPLVTDGEQVLIVRYDTTASTAVEGALTSMGVTFAGVTDTVFRTLTVDQLLGYEALFYIGNMPINSASEVLTMAYLDAGGSLFIADNDLGYSRRSGPNTLYNVYLQSTYNADNGGDIIVGEDLMDGLTLDITPDPYPDDFTIGSEGTRIFKYSTTNFAGGVLVERLDYKAIYVSFDFHHLTNVAHRVELLTRVLDFLTASDIPWLEVDPVEGSLAAGASIDIDLTFNTNMLLEPAVYHGLLTIKNNTPYGKVVVPVNMSVTPPLTFGKLSGTVIGDGHCDVNPVPLDGALVTVTSGSEEWQVATDAAGYYQIWVDESYSPFTVTVDYGPSYAPETRTGVIVASGATTVEDFNLRMNAPCIEVAPLSLESVLTLGDSETLEVTITNNGSVDLVFEIEERNGGFVPSTAPALPTGEVEATGSRHISAAEAAEAGLPTGKAPVLEAAGSAPEDIGTAWEVMAPLPSGRVFNAVIADENGFVYSIGGTSDGGATIPTNTVYRYDTAANTWSTMAPMPAALDSIDGIVISNKIYIPGGAASATTYVYDIAGNSWTSIAANGGYSPRSQYQAVAIGTDLYVLGGIVASLSASTTEVWKLDTTTGIWSPSVPMQKSRTSFSAGAIDGVIYVAGGVLFPNFVPDMTAEKFDGTSWSYIAPVPGGTFTRWSYNADAIGEHGLWLGAGRRDTDWNVLNHAGYYNPETNTWVTSPTIPILNNGRVYVEGDVASDGYFYVIGGRDGAGTIAYAHNERLYVGVAASPAVDWLSYEPAAGTVAPDGGSLVVDVTIDTITLTEPGTYMATLRIKSNDPGGAVSIPVTLEALASGNYGRVEGTVIGLGYCDASPGPLQNAQVYIEADDGTNWIVQTDAAGNYSLWIDESFSPVLVIVSADGYISQYAHDVVITGGEITVVDFDLLLNQPCIAVEPEAVVKQVGEGQTAESTLTIHNLGAAGLEWQISEELEVPASQIFDLAEGFDSIDLLPGQGWYMQNNSSPLGVTGWFQGNDTVFPAHSGAATSYIGANFNNTGSIGTISNWLLTPPMELKNGDVISFYTRIPSGDEWPDRLELRLSTNGASTNVGTAATDVGDFTTLLLSVNPGLTTGVYPKVWTEFTATISGLPQSTQGRLAFRYFVTNAGENGSNSNYIGIDTFTYTSSSPQVCATVEDIPWLSLNPTSGLTGAYSSDDVTLSFNAAGMEVGTYTGNLCVTSNDAHQSLVVVPVTMEVTEVTAMPVTFMYHDMEDVVASGEQVYIAGDFTGWQDGKVLMTEVEPGMFEASFDLEPGMHEYKYIVMTSGDVMNWNWLQSENREVMVDEEMMVHDYRDVWPGYYLLLGPESLEVFVGETSEAIYAELWADDLTARDGAPRGLKVEVGFGTEDDPAEWTEWELMDWHSQVGNNDKFMGSLTPMQAGLFHFAVRFTANWGEGNPNNAMMYADLDFTDPAFNIADAGSLLVNPALPESDLEVAITIAPLPVRVGVNTTFTAVVTNHGPDPVSGVVVSGELPANIEFISGVNCGLTAGVLSCDLGTIGVNESKTAVVVLKFTATGSYSITLGALGDQEDPVPGNNSGTLVIEVEPAVQLYQIFAPIVRRSQ